MNRANIAGAKYIREIGGHRGKAATIHRGDYAKGRRENADRFHACEGRCGAIAKHAKQEEDEIGRLPAN